MRIYDRSHSADKFLYSEQRSNVLLVSGEHYTRKNSKYWNKVRDSRTLTNETKIRLTKNHIQKITKGYRNNILSHAPGVGFLPHNEDEAQDRKSAELCQAVWTDAKATHDLNDKIRQWIDDYIEIGEVAVKLTWDEDLGEQIGWEPLTDESGQPIIDPQTGQMAQSEVPVMSGDFEFKRIFGFNFLRPTGIQHMKDAPWLGERDMVLTKTVKDWVKDDPSKLAKVTSSADDNFYVFDNQSYGYEYKKDHTLVISMYYKPSKEYPKGYYYIYTKDVILFEGELPYGVFPIVYKGFDSIQSNPRHRSIIKQLRPYQVEINRCASKIAEHQVTLGDDKLLIQSGTKLTNGVALPGVRSVQYSGRDPVILQGRSGAQYLDYMNGQIEELYRVAGIVEDSEEKAGQEANAFGQLFKSIRNKKKFSLYAMKFEEFLTEVAELYMNLARNYFDEHRMINAIGKNEAINISEFKNTMPMSYQVKAEPRTDDLEEQYGKQLVINHALQFVGNNLQREDIGRLMREMPFGNFKESFRDLTIDYDSANNMILAIERGQQPQPNKYDKAEYMINKLVARTREPSFMMLDPQIQQLFQQYIEYYEMLEVEQQRRILAANSEYIPTDGVMSKVDVYIPNKTNPDGKPERAVVPQAALEWLIKRLEDQGNSQEKFDTMNQGAVSDMAGQLLNQPRGSGQTN